MAMHNIIQSSLWLGTFIGAALGSLMGVVVTLASYPYIFYGRVMFVSFMFFLLGSFSAYSFLFGLEYFKARKSGMIYMWAEYDTPEILALMKEYQLQVKL